MQKHPASRPKQPTWPFNHASNLGSIKNSRAFTNAFTSFKANYPEYELGSSLDSLRKTEFGRLKKANEVYADYMGGCLWPECLVAAHTAILQAGLFGNTHSDSPWYVYAIKRSSNSQLIRTQCHSLRLLRSHCKKSRLRLL